jgi:hypothetical protein
MPTRLAPVNCGLAVRYCYDARFRSPLHRERQRAGR